MTCRKCNCPVVDPRDGCPGCGSRAGGWAEYAWLAATCLVPALWLAGYIAVLGFTG